VALGLIVSSIAKAKRDPWQTDFKVQEPNKKDDFANHDDEELKIPEDKPLRF
jgi:hypothetical protein